MHLHPNHLGSFRLYLKSYLQAAVKAVTITVWTMIQLPSIYRIPCGTYHLPAGDFSCSLFGPQKAPVADTAGSLAGAALQVLLEGAWQAS